MFKVSINTWFRNISIRKKLNFTIGIMAFLVVVELLALWGALHLLSGVRASVKQEGVWSKAQKNAINTLQQYAFTSDTLNYQDFLDDMEVNRWVKRAFNELKQSEPNRSIMVDAVIKSGVHPSDAGAVVDVFYNFNFVSYVNKCLNIFWSADKKMLELRDLAKNMHQSIVQNQSLNKAETTVLFNKLKRINSELSVLESEFSNTMGESGRWIDNIVLGLLLSLVLTIEFVGILMARSLNKRISKGINEVIRVSKKVAKGNFEEKAEVYSKDEIGVLATSFNEMVVEVKQINEELQQFAYIASHDLQEPLNTIASFNAQLQDPNNTWDEEKKQTAFLFISQATLRMQNLIQDLMAFSRVGRNLEMTAVNTNELIQDVLDNLRDSINKTSAIINIEKLPIITANEFELLRLFQNLISNAIKFQPKSQTPEVNLYHQESYKHHTFIVKDNGIGINPSQNERIFAVFQRLHNRKDYPGTGIGLAICRKVINLHKGQIKVVSEEGKGSEFHIIIPKNL